MLSKHKKITFLSISLFLIISSLILFSCKRDSAPPDYAGFPTEIGQIFINKCATAGCHNSISYPAADNLNLSSFASLFKGSSNGSPVIPYRSDFSSLCYFINTYDDLGIKNVPMMPLNGTPLSHEEVKTIKDWIDAGAPDINGYVMWSENPNRKKYYVLNQGCDVVTVFDAATQLPMRYINVGNKPGVAESPHMIKMSPDGQYWYVVFVGNSILQKFRSSDDSFVGEVNLGVNQNWNTITISNDGKRAYCVSWQASSRLAIVNLQNMQLKTNVGGFSNGHGIVLNNTNDTIYITAQYGNYIYKLDTALNTINQITIDGSGVPNSTPSIDPHEIIFSPDGSKYFLTCQGTNEVRVLSTIGNTLLQTISTGVYPQEIAKSNSKNKLYVTCTNDPNPNPKILGSVTMIDMNTYAAINYKVGYQPHGIAVDETNGYVIVASRNILTNGPTPHHTGVCGRNGFVNYFKINSMQLTNKETEVASDPYSITMRP